MRGLKFLAIGQLLTFTLLLGACSDQNQGKLENKPRKDIAEFSQYTLKGDIDAIQEKGFLRLLAPRISYNSLPRDSIPSEIYRVEAEKFAESLNLTPKWIYVDSYAELIPMLISGKGDVIATNFTVTEKRKQEVAFTKPVTTVSEVLVHKAGTIPDLDKGSLRIGVASGTSYYESAQKLQKNNPGIKLVDIAGSLSEEAILGNIINDKYDATIIDSNIVSNFRDDFPALGFNNIINEDRELAWAVRKNNTGLKNSINQFLISHSIVSSSFKAAKHDWSMINKHRLLRVITMNTPHTYFILRGELRGFDYELIKRFAEKHELKLQMIVRPSPETMIEALLNGEGDVIAGSLTENQARKDMGLLFSKPYLKVKETLIGNKRAVDIKTIEEMAGLTITVNPNASFYQTLLELQSQGIPLKINEVTNTNSESLIISVADGEYDYTVADSHLAKLEKTWRGNDIKLLLELGDTQNIAWAMRKDQPALAKKLNTFISETYRGVFYNLTYQRYFEHSKNINTHYEQRVEPGKSISPFDELIQEYAQKHNADWRLIASQIFQESRFDPGAKSYAGARGLMQLLPRTAKSFGYEDLEDPKENIAAGMAFKEWLKERFPSDLPIEEKTYFTLAAYNAGHGHVHDAQRLARKLGKNPYKWFGHVEEAMLKLSDPKYYRDARYGYVRGQEPVDYVRKIRDRYLAYVDAYTSP